MPQAMDPIWLGPVLSAAVTLALFIPLIIWMFMKWNRSPEGGVAVRTRSDNWNSHGSPDAVLGRIIEGARDKRAFVESRSSNAADMGIGSQTAFRIWGFITPSLSIPMQFHVAVHALDDHQTQVSVDARSNPGWYVTDFRRITDRIYARGFDALVQMLRQVSEEPGVPAA